MKRIRTIAVVLVAMLAAVLPANAEAVLRDMAIGSEKAPLTVIEYASMTCPHCAEFHTEVLPVVKREYIDTGKLRLIFRDFPLDGLALRASMLARCGGAERYFAFIDVLFTQQRAWSRAKDPVKALAHIARMGGVSEEAFQACMANKELENYVVQSRYDAQKEHKVSGTPSFVVNGKTYSGVESVEAFKEMVDPLLAGKGS